MECDTCLEHATTDTERLDYLQRLLDRGEYTGRATLRMSTTERGFRLHETSWERFDPTSDIRQAIDQVMANPGKFGF